MASGLAIEPREALGADIRCVVDLGAAVGAVGCVARQMVLVACIRSVGVRFVGVRFVGVEIAAACLRIPLGIRTPVDIVRRIVVRTRRVTGSLASCHGAVLLRYRPMPPLQSSMVPLGSPCPRFDLTDPRGFRMSDADAAGRP
ncbi:MAG: hypothetical protein ACK559_21220, partial [bacterium]